MCPGYVKTDMTGGANSKAPKTPEEAAETAVWLVSDLNEIRRLKIRLISKLSILMFRNQILIDSNLI